MNREPGSLAQSLTPYLGALLEAWHELRINRNRIMLSLVSVAAAVWAMSTVIALSNLLTSSAEASEAQFTGIPGTVTVTVNQGSADAVDGADFGFGADPTGMMFGSPMDAGSSGDEPAVVKPDGTIDDPFSDAALATVDRVGSTHWSRVRTQSLAVNIPAAPECDPMIDPTCFSSGDPEIHGVDPGWFDIYRRTISHGRALQDGDGERLMNPTVVNEMLWEQLGSPNLADHPTFTARETGGTQFTIVGVMNDLGSWDSPLAVVSYDTLRYAGYAGPIGTRNLLVTAPVDDTQQARRTLCSMMGGLLGTGWDVTATTADQDVEQTQQMNSMITKVLAIVGGIVIALGALGLLTVSIVTVGHRVREIGIRRAMGASAARIFISVFLESVVATTVAGVIGVVLSIITVKQMPVEDVLGLPMELGAVPYPLTAAFMGVAIASLVGALAGVIPATIAVRVKPIDAIRF